MDPADDALGPDALRDSGPASVDEAHDVAPFGGSLHNVNILKRLKDPLPFRRDMFSLLLDKSVKWGAPRLGGPPSALLA